MDTWWQTETGGVALAPRPSAPDAPLAPSKPQRPMFGMKPVLLDEKVSKLSTFFPNYLFLSRVNHLMAMMLVELCVLPHHGLVLLGLCLEITRDMLTHTFQCIQDIILLEMEL